MWAFATALARRMATKAIKPANTISIHALSVGIGAMLLSSATVMPPGSLISPAVGLVSPGCPSVKVRMTVLPTMLTLAVQSTQLPLISLWYLALGAMEFG